MFRVAAHLTMSLLLEQQVESPDEETTTTMLRILFCTFACLLVFSLVLQHPTHALTSFWKRSTKLDDSFTTLLPASWLDDDDDDEQWTHDPIVPEAQVTHFCFLLHGIHGLGKDLSYVRQGLRKVAHAVQDPMAELVVHSCVSNEGRTTDGIANNGQRVVEEMVQVIRESMELRQLNVTGKPKQITISLLGNSLGGLYGRYAIAELTERCETTEDGGALLLDGLYRLEWNVFCTTAAPHLGLASFTFIPLPRTAEIGLSFLYGTTGQDLFRRSSLLHHMATLPRYLDPLRAFARRIAYANAYGTDFPVPAQTAAFLSDRSSYLHHFVLNDDDDDDEWVLATLHTHQDNNPEQHVVENELEHMSRSLDALGWKKVFLDVRPALPKIPRLAPRNDQDCWHNMLQTKKGVVLSRDLADAVQVPLQHQVHWPVGHNLMVAFSRNRVAAYWNKGGRPIVDTLAKELVADMFSWRPKQQQ